MPNNRNNNRRHHDQSHGQHRVRQHQRNGIQPNGADLYRPNTGKRQHSRPPQQPYQPYRNHNRRGPGPIHLPSQWQPPQQQHAQYVGRPLQRQPIMPTQARTNSIVTVGSSTASNPSTMPFLPPYSLLLDPRFLEDLDPPGVDPKRWYAESMHFIEHSARYQRPETSIDVGTGWMRDIEGTAEGTAEEEIEARALDALQAFHEFEYKEQLDGLDKPIQELEHAAHLGKLDQWVPGDDLWEETMGRQMENTGYGQQVFETDEW